MLKKDRSVLPIPPWIIAQRHEMNMQEERKTPHQDISSDFESILDTIQDAYYRADAEGFLTIASRSLALLLGYSDVSDCLGRKTENFYAEPTNREVFLDAIRSSGKVTDYEVILRRQDGSLITVETSSHLLYDPEGHYLGVEGTFRDITERKRIEQVLHQALRARTAIGEVNRLRSDISDEATFLKRFCEILVMIAGYRMAWIGKKEIDVFQSVTPLASAGVVGDYLTRSPFTWGDDACGTGPTGMAIKTNRAVSSRFIQTDPHFTPWREAAIELGYASSIAIPIRIKGEIFGSLNIYSVDPDAFDDKERDLLEELTHDCEAGIVLIRDRQIQKQMSMDLLESEERLRLTLDATNDGIWDWDIPSGKVFFSPRWYTMLGYAVNELPGSFDTWRFLVHPDDLSFAEQRIQDHIQQKSQEYKIEFRMQTKPGGWRWILARGKVIERDSEGNPVRMVGTHSDITDRKQIQHELARKHVELMASYEQISANEEELLQNLEVLTHSEKTLQISEQRLLMAQEISHTGCWEFDPETNNIWGSAEGLRIFGFPPIAREMPIDIIEACAQNPDSVHQAIVDLLNEKKEYDIEFLINPVDGSAPRVVHSIARLEIDEERNIRNVIGVIQDITDLKKTETALRESEKTYRNLYQYAQVGLFETDFSDALVIACNQRYADLAGFDSVKAATGKNILSNYAHPGDREEVRKILHEQGYVRDHIVQFINQSTKNVFWGQFSARYNSERNVIEGSIIDISKQKDAEDALRDANSFLENLITLANVPIIVWTPEFIITRINQAFELLIGRSAADLLGKPLEILYPPSQVERSMGLIRTTLDGIRWETVEIDLQHQDGTVRTVIWNSSTIYTPDGVTPVVTIAQGQDITAQKRLEKEKTTALEQIQQNLAQLSLLNDGIRNPLTVILGYLDLLDESQEIDIIRLQIRRIDEMVTQLDKRWIESEKILNFLRRYHQIEIVKLNP